MSSDRFVDGAIVGDIKAGLQCSPPLDAVPVKAAVAAGVVHVLDRLVLGR